MTGMGGTSKGLREAMARPETMKNPPFAYKILYFFTGGPPKSLKTPC